MILLLTYLSFVLRAFCTADIPIRGIAVINGKDLDSAKSDSFIVYYGDSLMLECFLEDINNADIKESTDGYIENSYENIEWTLNGRLNNTWGTTLEFSYEELIRIGPKFLQFDCSKSEYGVYKFPLIRLEQYEEVKFPTELSLRLQKYKKSIKIITFGIIIFFIFSIVLLIIKKIYKKNSE